MTINKNSDLRRAFLYFFIYCPLGIICPLIGQYLSSIGFSGTQVGTITSLGTGTAILAGLFWGKIYANTSRKKILLAFMCLAAATLGVVSTGTTIFIIYAVIYSGMYFFQGPIHGLSDAFVLDRSEHFSAIRATGAAGYAVAVFVAGRVAESTGLKSIFFMYAGAYVIAACFFLREEEPTTFRTAEEKVKMSVLFKDRNFVKLLICAFFLMGTNVGNSTYFGYLFREQGGSVAGIGVAFLLMAGSEAPFMALTPVLSRKFGAEKTLLFAMVMAVIRFGFYSTGPDYKVLLATFFLQGMTNGIILVEIVKYFGRIVEPRLSSVSISVFYAIGNSLSVILCSFIGGIMLDMAGACAVYRFFAIFNFVSVILYIALGMHRRR
ncbi:MAG: MFS transporter [Candidatus Fimisoma sp.]|nr:MFS transporter [Bacillota bacterium]MDD7285402.1 MFS transporter [Bacillota bacterium]MDY4747834.1 MFS transporter [Candidatus Fimisoma sp.]